MYKSLANSSIIGRKLIFMPSCHSTNDICAELISNGDVTNGTIVITDNQYKGRGQGKNSWESEEGANLTLSIVLETDFLPLQDQFYLNMMVCLSLSELLTAYLNSGIYIKWPNDIFFRDKKICGILIQNILKGNRLEYSILGLGINVNQHHFKTPQAISLHNITGKWYDLEKVLHRLIEILEKYYITLKEGKKNELKKMYMARLLWLNENHVFETDQPFEGRITDVDTRGRLMIETDGALKSYDFKEIKFVK